jgi:integral membrane protein (TIGR01906 family)
MTVQEGEERQLKKIRDVCLALAFGLGLLFLVLLVNVQIVSYSVGYYQAEFAKLGQAEKLGTSMDQLALFSRHTTRYLAGLERDPNLQMMLYGEQRWLLNSREISHMQDVQKLFALARWLTAAGLLLLLLIAALHWRRHTIRGLLRGLVWVALAAILLALLGGWLISRDFTRAFDYFHMLAFTNDLWQLDPSQDQLINLLPEQFFSDAVLLVAIRSGMTLVLIALGAGIASRRPNNP